MSEPTQAAPLACQRHQREGCPMCLSPIVLDESTALPAPSRPATFLLGARVVGGIIRRGYDDMHLIVEDASGNQHRVVAHLADSEWRSAPWLLPVPDEHAKASGEVSTP